MILVAGGLSDVVTELVCARLESLGLAYRLVDFTRYPDGYRMRVTWAGGLPEGWIETDDWRLDLADVSAVYVRLMGADGRLAPSGALAGRERDIQVEADAAITAVIEGLPCLVVNRIAGGLTNHSKPLQALAIRAAGLPIPETLVTTSPDDARRFIDARAGQVIYKSISGVRSIVNRIDPEHLARLDLLRDGPAQFQEHIAGDDIRVHTVGDVAIATRIRSDATDYRYGGQRGMPARMEPTSLPADVEAACVRLARSLDLPVSGIDLKETPDGRHVCFEINPMPAFSYYEQHTGQPISLAIADLLVRGSWHGDREDAYATA
jgi:glutathione synthase/RimK-type ligase-like ATP-grasp enzyme